MTPDQRKKNLRFGLTLATIAIAIFLGFMIKSAVLGM